jgi:hypothetical protein
MRVDLLYIHLLPKIQELLKSLEVELRFIPTTFGGGGEGEQRGRSEHLTRNASNSARLSTKYSTWSRALKCHRGSETTNQFSNLINFNRGHSRSSKGESCQERTRGRWSTFHVVRAFDATSSSPVVHGLQGLQATSK